MQNNRAQAEKHLKDRDYKMNILRDDGPYRSLEFKHSDRMEGHFLITTWPGCLCITGDMGSFVFNHIDDTIGFFSGNKINPRHWSEKVVAQSIYSGGVKVFSNEIFTKDMLEIKQSRLSRADNDDSIKSINDAFEHIDKVSEIYEAVVFVRGLNLTSLDPADLSWPEEYTFHYLFACYAINFACNTYLHEKTK